jgi:PAS domain S-box-containing protein
MKDTTRILIIDQKAGRLNKVVKRLSAAGFQTKYILQKDYSPNIFLENWHVIILSASLSSMIRKIRSRRSFMPTPVLLVYASRPGRQKDPLKGADDFLVLPFPDTELTSRIQALRNKRKHCITDGAVHGAYDAFNRVTEVTRSGSDDLTILKISSREVERMIPGVRCTIIMLGEKKGKASALDFEGYSSVQNIPLDLKMYPEIRRVIETRQHLAIRDVSHHPLLKEVREFIRGKALYSFLLVPIFFQDEMIGLFFLRSIESKRSFLDIEISFMKMMAAITASALRNIRLSRSIETELIKARTAEKEARVKGKISRRLEKLFEHTADGLLIVDHKGQITDANTSFTQLSGYQKAEAMGMHVDQIFLAIEDNQKPLSLILKSKTQAALINYQLAHKSGGQSYVAAHLQPLPGQKREYLISLHDLTEKHQADLVVQRTKDFLESLIQHSMDAIMAADMQGTILVFNQAAEKITGYQADEVIGKRNIIDLYFPGGAKDIMSKLRSPHYGGMGKLETCTSTLISRHGEEIPINVSAAVIYNEDGEEVATVGIFQDLRERIKIEEQLRQAQERLLESQRKEAVSALAGAAAHELNQPLTSILGYAELLQRVGKNISGEETDASTFSVLKNAVDVIVQEAERMAGVVRKLGEITEYETKEYFGGVRIMDLDRKAAKEDPTARVNFWENLFKSSSLGIVTLGEDTIITRSNPAAELIAGESLVGKYISAYLEESQYSDWMKDFYKVVKGGKAEGELRIKQADGGWADVTYYASRIEGHKEIVLVFREISRPGPPEAAAGLDQLAPENRALEQVKRRLSLLQDITAGCRTDSGWEDKLIKILTLLQTAIDFHAAGLILPEHDKDMTLLSLDKTQNTLIREHILPGEIPWIRREIFLDQGPLTYDDIQLMKPSSGSEELNEALEKIKTRGLHSIIILPLLFQGEAMGALYLASQFESYYKREDISFLEQVASQVAGLLAYRNYHSLKSRLLHSEKLSMLGQMAAGIAHEMNNPLAAITASAEMLLASGVQGDLSAEAERAERIIECSQRLQNMIGNLMGFARPSTGEFSTIDVRDLIEKALAFSACEFQNDNLVVERNIQEGIPPIQGVPDQLQQVFINLLSNAAHACEGKDKPRIVISSQMTNNQAVEISVQDNGAGIDQNDIKRIFEPFFTSKADGRGTGLGLSIVQDIINRHGGKIDVESRPGEGSNFRVILPLGKEG